MTAQFFDENSRNFVHLSVLSLSIARNRWPLRSATRPWGLPGLCLSDRRQLNMCAAAALRVARACINFKIPFCFANPLGSYSWKLSGQQNLISKCVVLDIHHCALDHTGGKLFVFISEDS